MKNLLKIVVLAVGVATLGGALLSTVDLKAQTDVAMKVKERQDLMKAMGKSFGPIMAIMKGQSTDLAAAAAAAATMHDSMVKAAGLFPSGSANGEVEESRAKPEVWTKASEFKVAADALIMATAKLAEAAKSGDVDGFKAQVPLVGKSCGGCHEGKFKAGGKFRTPKEG